MSQRPLKVDQIARRVFANAAIACSMRDAELALQTCADLVQIESDYRLALRCGDQLSKLDSSRVPPADQPRRFSGIPLHARFAGKCHVCAGPIAVDESIIYSPELKKAAHDRCGEVSA